MEQRGREAPQSGSWKISPSELEDIWGCQQSVKCQHALESRLERRPPSKADQAGAPEQFSAKRAEWLTLNAEYQTGTNI